MIALLAPGQGSQSPGMLEPWLELDGASDRVAAWSEAAGLDLERLGTAGTAEDIKDTAVTQPLVVAASLLAGEELHRRYDLPVTTPAAGHSVGELAAAALAGVLDYDSAVRLAAVRGREMAEACALEPTGMAAVMGGDADTVLTRLTELGLDPANRNGAGQIVAAGRVSALEQLAAEPPEGARVKQLPVAGAFHTSFMASARDALDKSVRDSDTAARAPKYPLLSNADGTEVVTPEDILRRLVEQVTLPVRWDSCMAELSERGVDAVVELPPAGTLAGLARRELKGVHTLALKKPEDLDKLADLLPTQG